MAEQQAALSANEDDAQRGYLTPVRRSLTYRPETSLRVVQIRSCLLRSCCLLAVLVAFLGCSGQTEFEAKAWRSADPTERGKMVCDLLGIAPDSLSRHRNYLQTSPYFKNADRKAVIALLGKPDLALTNTAHLENGVIMHEHVYYDLGYMERQIYPKPDSLCIGFDEGGKANYVAVEK